MLIQIINKGDEDNEYPTLTVFDSRRAEIQCESGDEMFKIIILDADDTFDVILETPGDDPINGSEREFDRECIWSFVKPEAI